MVDMYLEYPELLSGKPKLTIGNYVEQNGILVPRRYGSLEEAVSSGKRFIARSEHPGEYSGASGLLHSYPISNSQELSSFIQLNGKLPGLDVRRYCELNGLNLVEFSRSISYSFWEHIEGFNGVMVADSAIKGRYHVICSWEEPRVIRENGRVIEDDKFGHASLLRNSWGAFEAKTNYSILDNRALVYFTGDENSDASWLDGMQGDIDFYESVRKLGNFEPNHCPIVEYMREGEKRYFLQYHRTRDFEPAGFRLSRNGGENEQEALIVRGATKGLVVRTRIAYSRQMQPADLPQGIYFCSFPDVTQEALSSKLQVVFMDIDRPGHTLLSMLFNPEISIVTARFEDLVGGVDRCLEIAESPHPYVTFNIVSDGRRALIKPV